MLSASDIGTTLPGGYINSLGGPADAYYAHRDGTPYVDAAEACAAVPVPARKSRTVNVAGVEMQWLDDTSDAGLKAKSASADFHNPTFTGLTTLAGEAGTAPLVITDANNGKQVTVTGESISATGDLYVETGGTNQVWKVGGNVVVQYTPDAAYFKKLVVFEAGAEFQQGISVPNVQQGDASQTVANTFFVAQAVEGKADLVAGKVPAAQLPSYVDDVLEFANRSAFPASGETGKMYVALDTNRQYRWSGSTYIQLVASPGTTDDVLEGATNKYFAGARVLGTTLTSYAKATARRAVAASDTLLVALGVLEKKVDDAAAGLAPLLGQFNGQGANSLAVGGQDNQATGYGSTVVGGAQNTLTADNAFIGASYLLKNVGSPFLAAFGFNGSYTVKAGTAPGLLAPALTLKGQANGNAVDYQVTLQVNGYSSSSGSALLVNGQPLGLRFRGDWQANTFICKHDVSIYQGAVYIALQDQSDAQNATFQAAKWRAWPGAGNASGPAYTAGAGIAISSANVISASGIDYANPLKLTAAATLEVNKAYTLTGSGYAVTLPDPATTSGAIFVLVDKNATGLYTLIGSNYVIYARESLTLRAGTNGWAKTGGELLAMNVRLETLLSQQDALPAGVLVTIPLTKVVEQVVALPALINLSAKGIVVQRDGRATISASVALADTVIGGEYFLVIYALRGGSTIALSQSLVPCGPTLGQLTLGYSGSIVAGDLITAALYNNNGQATVRLRGQNPGSQCVLVFSEIV